MGEVFKPCVATVTYEDGSTETVAVTPEMVKGFDTSKLGNYNIEITINGVTKVMTITVVEKGEEAHVHSMELTAAKEATCTEGGNNAYYHCSGCNKYFKDEAGMQETTVEAETISAAGHKWNNGEVTTAATCTEDGVMTFTCSNCNETKTETIPAGNVIVNGECTVCGDHISYTEGLEYTLSSDESYYIVTGIGTASGDIIIPDTHEGLPVTYIGSSAFENCSSLKSIEIPAGVTSIGSIAFRGCSNLNTVYYAGSIENWFDIVFSDYFSNPLYYGAGLYIGGEPVTEVVVPESITTIGTQLRGCTSLTSITIHSGVTSIGEDAFYGCSSLTSIEIPAGVTSIGGGAFEYCSSLASVTFAEGSQLTSIGDSAFSRCSSLTSIEIPAGVTGIGDWAFSRCSSLTSIEIPAGVTSIGYQAFYRCSNLESVTFAEGSQLTSIGSYAFYYCSNLESVTFAEGSQLTSIGSDAFYGCSNLTSIEIPAGVTSIGSSAFSGCSNLESVTFAEGSQLTNIGSLAFYYCSSLTSIEIPVGVTSIGNSAFYGCYLTIVYNYSDLEITAGSSDYGYVAYYAEVVLTEENQDHINVDENGYITYTDGEKILLLGYLGSEKDIVIPEGVTRIAKYAFYDNDDVISVTLPESLTEIGNSAFGNCYKLKEIYNNSALDITVGSYGHGDVAYYAVKVHDSGESESIFNEDGFAIVDGVLYGYNGSETVITIPDIVTSIGEYAFRGNDLITSVSIPARVTSIGDYAFEYCSSLTSINIPAEVTSIGSYAFLGCTDLIQIENGVNYVDKWVVDCDNPVGRVTLRSDTVGIGDHAFSGCTGLKSVTIGDSVTSIGDGAFYQCGLTTVTIGNSVITIGSMAFCYCSGLKSVTIPDSVTSIGGSAFSYCTGLKSVTIGAGVTSIRDGVFSNCGLTSITIPDSVTSIGGMAFWGCSGLTSVTIPHNVTSIGGHAFSGCSGLTEINWNAVSVEDFKSDSNVFADAGTAGAGIAVTFGESVQKIPAYAFYKQFNYLAGCPNIKSVTIGSNVTSIGSSAFEDCTGLTSVTIGDSVTSIGSSAFYGCSNLESVTFAEGSQLTSIGNYSFYGCSSLQSIEIPAGVTSIGDSAFYDCSNLDTVYYAGSIEDWFNIEFESSTSNPLYYGADLYIGGELVTAVVVPESITTIGTQLRGCTSLTSITIHSGVTSIGSSAFYDCSNLESVTFAEGSGLTSIGSGAFWDCSSLKSIDIPAGVTSIGSDAFYRCSSLETIYYNGTEEQWNSIDKDPYWDYGCGNHEVVFLGDAGAEA